MMNKKMIRWLATYLIVDGLLTLILGRKYVRVYRFGSKKSLYRRMMDKLLSFPSWQLRGAGAAEATLGLAVLSQEPMAVNAFYRLVASAYAAIDPGWREWFYPHAHDVFDQALSNNLQEGGDILDLACGVGANIARIQAMQLPFNSYTGVDITDAMLKHAQDRYGKLPGVSFQQLDLMRDTLPEGPYDLIISTWAFEHLSDPVMVANKAWEKLKPNGKMVLLFESQHRSLPNTLTGMLYPLIGARRIRKEEYQQFPGQVMQEEHFSGPFGRLTLLELRKTL